MLDENDEQNTSSGNPSGDTGSSDSEPAPQRRPRRAASRPAGPPPDVASPFMAPVAAPAPSAPVEQAPPENAGKATGTNRRRRRSTAPDTTLFQAPDLKQPAPSTDSGRGEEGQGEDSPRPSDDTDADGDGGGQGRKQQSGRKQGKKQQGKKQQGKKQNSDEAAAGGSRKGGRAQSKDGAAGDEAAQRDVEQAPADGPEADATSGDGAQSSDEGGSTRRRRRRRRGGGSDEGSATKDKGRDKQPAQGPTSTGKGSTRLEAKKQRRREGREAGRRRAPILTESEFLARRESVTRQMILRQSDDRTQIAVTEDGVLVEHYVTHAQQSANTMVGNVYLGRVQNVLSGMEAAFVDIGRGRNAVIYAGEVNWDAAGLEGQPKRIELALKSGDPVLVQVTKDPIGHKGARLTSQVSLPGRYLVFVPDGSMTGISRKLPDAERQRLRALLKKIVPDNAGIIVRTAAEGASEEELTRDVNRLAKQWEDIKRKAEKAHPPAQLHGEPDLAIRVVRDVFNEDFETLTVAGPKAWATVSDYVETVAPDLAPRLSKWTRRVDVFAEHRIDEQLAKALDRKVWLPSGGSLIIDDTEAMTVVDVNTGKFTGKGGNLEQTVTQNNLEAAEEIVRQIRLRDIGGIIVIDFIDMVLESNRDLVLRRLVECLGRDRTKHQVAEVTSLGLVQMTRKRIGGGLLETFSETCEHCHGRGLVVSTDLGGSAAKSRGGSRTPARPSGAHDPIEAMKKTQDDSDAPSAEDGVQEDQEVEEETSVEAADAAEVADVESTEGSGEVELEVVGPVEVTGDASADAGDAADVATVAEVALAAEAAADTAVVAEVALAAEDVATVAEVAGEAGDFATVAEAPSEPALEGDAESPGLTERVETP